MLHDDLTDFNTALRAAQDPATPPEILAFIAQEHPSLHPLIASHPNAYGPITPATPPSAPIQLSTQPSPTPPPVLPTRPNRSRTAIGAIAIAIAVVLVVVAALVLVPRFHGRLPGGAPGSSASPTGNSWTAILGGSDDDHIWSVASAPDGSVYAVGFTGSTDGTFPATHGGICDAVAIKFTSDGILEWAKTFGGSQDDAFRSVAVNADGSIIAVGYTSSSDGDFGTTEGLGDALIVKISSNGDIVWSDTFGGSEDDQFNSVAITKTGDIFAVGYTRSTDGDFPSSHTGPIDVFGQQPSDAIVVKVAADGHPMWTRTYGGSSDDMFNAVAITADNGIVVVGSTASDDGDFPRKYHTKYDFGDNIPDALAVSLTTDGALIWAVACGGSEDDELTGVAVGKAGDIVAVGNTLSLDGDFPDANAGSGFSGALIIQFSHDGLIDWAKTYGGSGYSRFDGVAFTDDGDIICAGGTASPDGKFPTTYRTPDVNNWDALLVSFTASGTINWFHVYGGDLDDSFVATAIATDGGILISGSTRSTTGDLYVHQGGYVDEDNDWYDGIVAKATPDGIIVPGCTGTGC